MGVEGAGNASRECRHKETFALVEVDRDAAGTRRVLILGHCLERAPETRMREPLKAKIDGDRGKEAQEIHGALGSELKSEYAGRRHVHQTEAAPRRPILVQEEEINDDVETESRDRKARTFEPDDWGKQE